MSDIRPHGRELLEAARKERTPGAADRERVFGALMATAALSSAAGAAAAPSLVAKLVSGAGKWLLFAGLASGVAGGLYLSARRESPPKVVPGAAAAPSAAAVHGALVPKLEPPSTSAVVTSAPAASALAPPPRSSVGRHDAAPASLEEELASLHAAHAAYRNGDPGKALALLAEDKARFPKSQLATERATLEVLALCRVGRTGEARRLADGLRRRAGSAAALGGLDGSCAAK